MDGFRSIRSGCIPDVMHSVYINTSSVLVRIVVVHHERGVEAAALVAPLVQLVGRGVELEVVERGDEPLLKGFTGCITVDLALPVHPELLLGPLGRRPGLQGLLGLVQPVGLLGRLGGDQGQGGLKLAIFLLLPQWIILSPSLCLPAGKNAPKSFHVPFKMS